MKRLLYSAAFGLLLALPPLYLHAEGNFLVRPWAAPEVQPAPQKSKRPSTKATVNVPDKADFDALQEQVDRLGNAVLELQSDVAKIKSGSGGDSGNNPPPPPPPPPAQFGITLSSPVEGATVKGKVPFVASINGCKNVEVHQGDWGFLGDLTISGDKATGDIDLSNLSGSVPLTTYCWDSSKGQPATQTATAKVTLNIESTGTAPVQTGALIDPVTKPGAERPGYKLTFNKEFKNTGFETNVWKTFFYFGDRTLSSNGERQYYMDPDYKGSCAQPLGVNPFVLDGNNLTIIANPTAANVKPCIWGYNWTSGLITTENSFSQTYGYFEARVKLPEGKGLWPAFWLLPKDKSWPPELDPLEAFGATNANGEGGSNQFHYGAIQAGGAWVTVPAGVNLYDSFHTYGIDWQPGGLDFYFDGQKVGHTSNPSNKPMYMLANLAVGGNWPGLPDTSTKFPARYQIDYIRAWAKQ